MKGRWALPVVVLGLSTACNGGGSGEGDTSKPPEYTRKTILEACVRMHSCGVERLTRVSDCVKRYGRDRGFVGKE